MGRVNRTAQCKKCGGTELKILSYAGKVSYICAACDAKVGVVECDKYETLYPTCKACNANVFKVRIEEDESVTRWNAKCNKCNASPETYYCNADGEVIDHHERQLLIIEDSVSGILNEIDNLKRGLSNLVSNENDLSEEELITDNYIDGPEEDIIEATNNLSGIDAVISNIEKAVADIQCRIKQL